MFSKAKKRFILSYLLVLVLTLIVISRGLADKRRRKNKKNSQSTSSNEDVRHVGRSGIKPVQPILRDSELARPTPTANNNNGVQPSSSTSISLPKIRSRVTLTLERGETFPLLSTSQVNEPTTTAPDSSDPMVRDSMGRNGDTPPTNANSVSISSRVENSPPNEKISTATSVMQTVVPGGNINRYACELDKRKHQIQDERLCGYPAFYNQTHCAEIYCSGSPLSQCENRVGMILFGVISVLLGLLTVFGNCLLPYVVFRQRNMRNRHNYIKVSLAFADMLVGIILVCSVLPNMLWMRSLSEIGLVDTIKKEENSAVSVLAGSLLIVSSESSLLHLTFLTLERFITIKRSMQGTLLKMSTIGYCLIAIWIISILLALTPAIFPDKFEYTILPVLSMYMITTKTLPDGSFGYHGPLYGGLTILIPYTLMVIFCILTGIMTWQKLRRNRSPLPTSRSSPPPGLNLDTVRFATRRSPTLRLEVAVFRTLLVMVVAFSITILPPVAILVLYNTNNLHCENYSLAYTLAFFAGMSNSFVNVIIYTVRDERFRKAIALELSSRFKRRNEAIRTPKNNQEVFSISSNLF